MRKKAMRSFWKFVSRISLIRARTESCFHRAGHGFVLGRFAREGDDDFSTDTVGRRREMDASSERANNFAGQVKANAVVRRWFCRKERTKNLLPQIDQDVPLGPSGSPACPGPAAVSLPRHSVNPDPHRRAASECGRFPGTVTFHL